jgi:hypothetical protein
VFDPKLQLAAMPPRYMLASETDIKTAKDDLDALKRIAGV